MSAAEPGGPTDSARRAFLGQLPTFITAFTAIGALVFTP